MGKQSISRKSTAYHPWIRLADGLTIKEKASLWLTSLLSILHYFHYYCYYLLNHPLHLPNQTHLHYEGIIRRTRTRWYARLCGCYAHQRQALRGGEEAP